MSRMNEIRYDLSVGQRMIYLIAGIVMVAAGVLATLAGRFSIFLVIGLVFIAYFFLFAKFGATIDTTGVHVRGLSTKHIPWQQIQGVETFSMLGTKGVKLVLAGGGSKKLRAPITGIGQKDPEFDTKVATIRQWWQHYTAAQPV